MHQLTETWVKSPTAFKSSQTKNANLGLSNKAASKKKKIQPKSQGKSNTCNNAVATIIMEEDIQQL